MTEPNLNFDSKMCWTNEGALTQVRAYILHHMVTHQGWKPTFMFVTQEMYDELKELFQNLDPGIKIARGSMKIAGVNVRVG